MNPDKKAMLLLALLAEQSGDPVSETRIEYTFRALAPFLAHGLCDALEKLIESSRRFPTIAEVKDAMGVGATSSRDEALMLAETIITAVRKYGELPPGHAQGAAAIERAIGPSAWELALRLGGWNAVVDRVGENQTAFRAQARDAAEAYLKTGLLERGKVPLELPSHHAALEAVKGEAPSLPPSEKAKLEHKLCELRAVRSELIAKRGHDA